MLSKMQGNPILQCGGLILVKSAAGRLQVADLKSGNRGNVKIVLFGLFLNARGNATARFTTTYLLLTPNM